MTTATSVPSWWIRASAWVSARPERSTRARLQRTASRGSDEVDQHRTKAALPRHQFTQRAKRHTAQQPSKGCAPWAQSSVTCATHEPSGRFSTVVILGNETILLREVMHVSGPQPRRFEDGALHEGRRPDPMK